MKNVMVDIETLGETPGCVILSIGAVEFDENGVSRPFHVTINIRDSLENGMFVEADSLRWWFDECSKRDRSLTYSGQKSVYIALKEFVKHFDFEDTLVWANGLNFDIPILEEALRRYGIEIPWEYYNLRDFRTLKELSAPVTIENTEPHNALSDAIAQAKTVIALLS